MIQASDFTLISSNRDLTGHSRESDDIAIHSTKTQKTAWQQCSSWHLNNKGQHSINIYSEHKVLLRWIKTLGVGFKGFRVQAQFNTVPEGGGHSYGITITIIVNYNYVNLSVFNTNSKGQRLAHKHHVTWKFPHTDSLGLQLCRLPHAHGHVQTEACAYMCTQRHCTRTHVHTHAHAYTNAHTRFQTQSSSFVMSDCTFSSFFEMYSVQKCGTSRCTITTSARCLCFDAEKGWQ